MPRQLNLMEPLAWLDEWQERYLQIDMGKRMRIREQIAQFVPGLHDEWQSQLERNLSTKRLIRSARTVWQAMTDAERLAEQAVQKQWPDLDWQAAWSAWQALLRHLAVAVGGLTILSHGMGSVSGIQLWASGVASGDPFGTMVADLLGMAFQPTEADVTWHQARSHYTIGFAKSWCVGELPSEMVAWRDTQLDYASHAIADGHLLVVEQVLQSMQAALGQEQAQNLLTQLRQGGLGQPFADWVAGQRMALVTI
ncbi:hypothetical protein HNQ59_001853 [Chitinivorax tropicus]|uniref:NAD(+)--protein-arginine ADP-ribosyltransferase Tre1-like N-terminal domain-containing protein n=1 Tax=Chitinivorax tropicus TaxID=714531 RepID=A0A840MH65_9PROT|nr:hypothetical protein [Chitinivorax tropicus]MBB5018564.1 hypothetical protein [Chitinivorax tropicus]